MSETLQAGAQLLYTEALYLDSQRWDDWLSLYEEDCEFWVPAWRAEHQLTTNPRTELSLVYYRSRAGLEERVLRVRSGRSAASTPLPRTQHSITNVLVQTDGEQAMTVLSNWMVHEYLTKQHESRVQYGRYEHGLVLREGAWRIRRKKVVLLNDYMSTVIDFYSF
jgi:3-phenylpropionate/cinnamic acid dioxygenase small subunit